MKSRILIAVATITFLITFASQPLAAQNYRPPTDLDYAAQANGYFQVKNYQAAWMACNEAIKLNPNQWIYYYFRGDCSLGMGNYGGALADYNVALGFPKNNEANGSIHLAMAMSCAAINDMKSAQLHLSTSARLGILQAKNLCAQYNVPY